MTTADSFIQFDQHRPFLFGLAYRMTGSVLDAEDMVQETYLRWEQVDPGQVESPRSYLAAVITRLSIDYLRSARVRREEYIGPWLPEPLLTSPSPGVDDMVAMSESLSLAFLVLLESLTPTERAVFLLHEVFAYEYREIAPIVNKSEANCRQLLSRARQKIRAGRPRFSAVSEAQEALADRFAQALTAGDIEALLPLLDEEAILSTDGGGKAKAVHVPVEGAVGVARFLLHLMRQTSSATTITAHRFNHEPGFVVYEAGRPLAVMVLETDAALVHNVRIVVNPDKLQRIPTLA